MLTHDLKNVLLYCPATGAFMWKTKAPRGKQRAWDVAGSLAGNGYLQIKFRGKVYAQHRLAYQYVYGAFEGEIDHMNGCKQDNRIANLRVVTRVENMQNMQKSKGPLGLGTYFDKRRNKFVAQIKYNGSNKYLGQYDTAKEASEMYLKFKREHFPFFAG